MSNSNTQVIKKIERQITDSVNWISEHFPDSYTQSKNCERCFLGGLCFSLALLKGTTQQEEYQRAVSRIESAAAKKKTVKRPAKKRVVVVRRKK